MSRFLFVIMISLLIVLNIYLITAEEFGYDTKTGTGTSGSSTVTILTNGTDTNETTRFNVLVGTDCSAGDFVIGVQTNGALLCATPLSVGDNASWNQSLYYSNATSTFVLLTSYNTNYSANDASYRNMTNISYVTWAEVTNGTISGGGITWTNATNGTLFTTALYNTNYTTNHLAYLNTTNLTYDAYNSTGLIRDWNVSGHIKNWSANISDANTSLYNWVVAQAYTANGITWANAINGTLVNWTYAMNGTLFRLTDWQTNYTSNNNKWLNVTNITYVTWAMVTNGTVGGVSLSTLLGFNYYNSTNPPPWNATNTSYVTYTNLSNSNVNGSNYWDSYDTANTTQFENSGGKLQLIMSWFIDAFNSVFSSKTTNDLTQGSTNLYDNKSWNQSLYYSNATASFALIGASEVDPYWTGNKSAYANYSNLTLFFLKISDWNATNASYYLITNPYGFFNSTSNIGNWSADKSNYSNYSNNTLTFSTISEPLWTDNFTKYNTTWSAGITWANAINGTLVNWTYAMNGTLFRLSDWQTNYSANDQIYRSFSLNYSDYLIIRAYALNDSRWTANYSAFLNKRDLTNNTFTGQSNFTGNINMTNQNITQISYSTFCNGANCWRMYVNSSDWFIIEGI